MKLARIHGPNDVRLDEVPEPVCGPDDAILEVAACGICGSDVGYAKIGGIQVRADSPFPIGHELAGVVAELGKNVRGVKVGTRVALPPRRRRLPGSATADPKADSRSGSSSAAPPGARASSRFPTR